MHHTLQKKTGTSGSKNRPIVKDHSSRNPNPKTPKMMSGGFGIFSKKKKDKAEKKESNESKKKKRLEELRKEISTMNKGGMADYYKDLM